jgi:peptidyl-prolyl cis-trans isomerase C
MRACVSLLLLCAGCRPAGDVAVVVDGVPRRSADVRLAGDRERLVDQTLLAAHARALGVDVDADVAARVRKAERDALAAAVLEKVVREATSDEAVQRAWAERREQLARKRVHVAHIVVPDGVDGVTVLARLRGGEEFAAIARALSADPSSARGGELPPLFEGQVDDAFFAAAWALKAGETSDVVASGHARHIIRALEAPTLLAPTFEEARSTLAATLGTEASSELQVRLRADADITVVEAR